MNNEAINKIESLDEYFPEGDKRRGEALILVAEAFLLGKESANSEKLKKIKWWGRSYTNLEEKGE